MRDEKRKMEKQGKTNLNILFFFPTIYFATRNGFTKFEDSEFEKSVTEKLIEEKEK